MTGLLLLKSISQYKFKFFRNPEKIRKNTTKIDKILSVLVKKVFQNCIIWLVKIQIS
jgi:hypothetical protein